MTIHTEELSCSNTPSRPSLNLSRWCRDAHCSNVLKKTDEVYYLIYPADRIEGRDGVLGGPFMYI